MLGGGGGLGGDLQLALLEIVRSLGGAPAARDGLRGAGVMPRLVCHTGLEPQTKA